MKTLLYIMSLCAAYIFLSVQFDVLAQSSSPAATRAYCDNNRNVAVQMAYNMSTNLQQELKRVSRLFPNAEGSNWNFMVSDNMEYDLILSTNSHGMNISFGRTYDKYRVSSNYTVKSQFLGKNRYISDPYTNYLNDLIYFTLQQDIRDNESFYNVGFYNQNHSFYIGDNIFNFSTLMADINTVTNYNSNHFILARPELFMNFMTNRNIVIGNDIYPWTCLDITKRIAGLDFNIDRSIIISADLEETPYMKKMKAIGGFDSCIVLDALEGESLTNLTYNNYYGSSGAIGNNDRLKHKICISVPNGLDDIMIMTSPKALSNGYTPLSVLIGQMVTNIVNQMRPQ